LNPAVRRHDAVVLGAGPAGLTAATYLGRFRRDVLVLDGGRARAAWIPESHNTPGFPGGIGGPELLARLRDQAEAFGAVVLSGRVEHIEPSDAGFRLQAGEVAVEAATVLLATGVVDRIPEIPGIEAAIRESLVRMCPICDAYEAIDARVAVLGDDDLAFREADFLRTYSADVTVLTTAGAAASREAQPVGMADLAFEGREVVLRRPGSPERRFDFLYLALGCRPQAALASSLGARKADAGELVVDSHQMTTVEGLYAAGDVVRGLNQISVAVGEAAIAATAMHNRLRGA
jgi:thioredoxin reductase (NADPH)